MELGLMSSIKSKKLKKVFYNQIKKRNAQDKLRAIRVNQKNEFKDL
jgi:hypothetical protein